MQSSFDISYKTLDSASAYTDQFYANMYIYTNLSCLLVRFFVSNQITTNVHVLPVPRLFLPVNSSRQLQRISHSFHCQLQEVQRKLYSRKIGIENHDVFKISFGSPVCALCGWC